MKLKKVSYKSSDLQENNYYFIDKMKIKFILVYILMIQ